MKVWPSGQSYLGGENMENCVKEGMAFACFFFWTG